MDDILFKPLKIGTMRLKNRLVRSATSERAADSHGIVQDGMIKMYEELAKGGAGLVITGYAYVHPSGRCGAQQTGIHSDSVVPRLKKLTDAFHRASSGGKIALQLVHGGRQAGPSLVKEVLAPSEIPIGTVYPREMREDEIQDVIEAFADAAGRAMDAGFDAVQLHGAHGFLISQFLSPYTNHRSDQWGGSPEGRWRFFFHVIRRIRQKAGDKLPLLAKVNGSDFLKDQGLNPDEVALMLPRAQGLGLDAVEISGGMSDTPQGLTATRNGIKKPADEAYFLPQARVIKKSLQIPLILVGGIRSAHVARKIIEDGDADAVAMCRPFLQEPDLPSRWMKGLTQTRCDSCISCLSQMGDVEECIRESGG